MNIAYFDTETCGLHGPAVLIQVQFNNGEIYLHDVWLSPVKDTLALIRAIVKCDIIVGFNLTFDWFHF